MDLNLTFQDYPRRPRPAHTVFKARESLFSMSCLPVSPCAFIFVDFKGFFLERAEKDLSTIPQDRFTQITISSRDSACEREMGLVETKKSFPE